MNKFTKENPMRVISLFSGIGAFEKGLQNLDIPFELVNFCEVDKYAVESYCAIYGESKEKNLGDITKVNIGGLPTDIDLITHGSPCFPKGAKILTDVGYKNIEDIKNGDRVLTHTNEYKDVYMLMESESSDLYSIKPRSSIQINATGNHPFYVRKMNKVWDNSIRRNVRYWEVPEWKCLKELDTSYYTGIAINNKSELPLWCGVDDNRNNNLPKINRISKLFDKKEFWYFIGRYMGDGWSTIGFNKIENKPTYKTTICCGKNELDELLDKFGDLFKYTVEESRTTYKVHFYNKELTRYLQQFGKGATNKKLTSDVLNLPIHLLNQFMNGYIDSDGCFTDNTYKMSSVSEELIIGVGQCIAKVYSVPYSMYKTIRPRTCIIEGRTVNQKDTYSVTFKLTNYKEGFVENGILWSPIREIKKLKSESTLVYNLEVEEDHSYTVNNIIVHNCTDFSVAGLNKGGDIDSNTRSSLMWNTVAIVEHCNPKIVIWENVKNVLSKKHIHNFDKYLASMEQLGYTNYHKVLNAKDFGVPQNRERIFVVSIRNDQQIDFKFPTGGDTGIRLKDILLDEVEERFYVPKDKTEKLLQQLLDKNIDIRGVNISGQGTVVEKTTDIANCILARDYKGLGNQPMTGAICVPIQTPDILNKSQNGRRAKTDGENMYTLTANDIHGVIIDDTQGFDGVRTYNDNVPTLRANRSGLKVARRLGGLFDDEKGTHQAGSVFDVNGLSPTLDTMQGGYRQACVCVDELRIRRLTPLECWLLMAFDIESFNKARFKKEVMYLEGGLKCSARLKVVKENQRRKDLETYAYCTTRDLSDMGTVLLTKQNKEVKIESLESLQNVNIVIEMLEGLEQLDYATNTIKWQDCMETLCTMTEELDLRHMVIIELEERGRQNIGRYMKITLEENCTQTKLYTISTLIKQIIQSKIYTCIVQKANIQGFISIAEDCKKNSLMMKLLNLKMEYITERNSNSALFKQAGNSIVVTVIMAIYENLFGGTV